jgi:hypothetical protein
LIVFDSRYEQSCRINPENEWTASCGVQDVIRLIKLKLGDLLLSQLSPGCVQLCAVFVFDSRYLLYPGFSLSWIPDGVSRIQEISTICDLLL